MYMCEGGIYFACLYDFCLDLAGGGGGGVYGA